MKQLRIYFIFVFSIIIIAGCGRGSVRYRQMQSANQNGSSSLDNDSTGLDEVQSKLPEIMVQSGDSAPTVNPGVHQGVSDSQVLVQTVEIVPVVFTVPIPIVTPLPSPLASPTISPSPTPTSTPLSVSPPTLSTAPMVPHCSGLLSSDGGCWYASYGQSCTETCQKKGGVSGHIVTNKYMCQHLGVTLAKNSDLAVQESSQVLTIDCAVVSAGRGFNSLIFGKGVPNPDLSSGTMTRFCSCRQ